MSNDVQVVRSRTQLSGIMGPLWFWGWLYTIGYLHLHVPKAIYAIMIWPYYLGQFFSRSVG